MITLCDFLYLKKDWPKHIQVSQSFGSKNFALNIRANQMTTDQKSKSNYYCHLLIWKFLPETSFSRNVTSLISYIDLLTFKFELGYYLMK